MVNKMGGADFGFIYPASIKSWEEKMKFLSARWDDEEEEEDLAGDDDW